MAKNQKQLKDALSWQRNDINYTECDKSFIFRQALKKR